MEKLSRYLLFAFLLFVAVLGFAIDAEDQSDSRDDWEIHFGDIPAKVSGIGLSSGFLIGPCGYIFTGDDVNGHTKLVGILTSNGIDYGLTVVACDPACDWVLLEVEVPPGREFRGLPMVDSDVVEAGDIDCSVPSRWVRELLDEVRSGTGQFEESER